MHTNLTAAIYIARAISSESAKDSEIDAIARDIYRQTGSWDMSKVSHDVFWAAVWRHIQPWSD
jgi:hypothetical protein